LGQTVQLKGCAWYETYIQKMLLQPFAERIQANKSLGVTLVRLPICRPWWNTDTAYHALIENCISSLMANDIYVILDFHWDGPSGGYSSDWSDDQKYAALTNPVWVDNWINWWSARTTEYVGVSGIIFSIFCEPPGWTHPDITPIWADIAIRCIRAIHAIDPNRIVLCPNSKGSVVLHEVPYGNPEPNTVYSVHRYYNYDLSGYDYAKQYQAGNFDQAKATMETQFISDFLYLLQADVCIMLDEFGFRTVDTNWDTCAKDWYELLDKYDMSWCQWYWTPIVPESLYGLTNLGTVDLSPQGQIWQNYLEPTPTPPAQAGILLWVIGIVLLSVGVGTVYALKGGKK
jgi:hypothetical protein